MKELVKIIRKMRANASEEWHPAWKNIPLAKEMADILQEGLQNIGKDLTATDIIACCDSIFLEDFLDTREVPRLCLKFLALREEAKSKVTPSEEQYEKEFVMDDAEAARIRRELEAFIDPSVSMEEWMELAGAHLKFDPVERTEEYEDLIYDVEKECDRRLKGEPRGMGFCFSYWATRRAVLAAYGIEWRSPSYMNPRVMFD